MTISSYIAHRFDISGRARLLRTGLDRLYGSKKILFFHVPKCGGTSLSQAFRMKFLLSHHKVSQEISAEVCLGHSFDDLMKFRQRLFLYEALRGRHFVQGHVAYSPEFFDRLRDSHLFMTILRRPEERVISQYFFEPQFASVRFSDFLDSRRGQAECSTYSRYFGGLPSSGREAATEHISSAINVLEGFQIVGILELPEFFEEQIRRSMGWRLKLPRRNVGKLRRTTNERITNDDRSRLAAMCSGDAQIYNYFLESHRGQSASDP